MYIYINVCYIGYIDYKSNNIINYFYISIIKTKC